MEGIILGGVMIQGFEQYGECNTLKDNAIHWLLLSFNDVILKK